MMALAFVFQTGDRDEELKKVCFLQNVHPFALLSFLLFGSQTLTAFPSHCHTSVASAGPVFQARAPGSLKCEALFRTQALVMSFHQERLKRMRLFSRQPIVDQTVKAENYIEQSIG